MGGQFEASYSFFSASSGFSKENRKVDMCEKGKKLEISFKVRKVLIHRPWLETAILKYPTIGIKGLKAGTWSTGELDANMNKGQFPILPTAMIVAKDVLISSSKFDSKITECFDALKTNSSLSVVSITYMASRNKTSFCINI